MAASVQTNARWKHWLPWIVSGATLGYVSLAVDREALIAATRTANLPLFVAVTAADKLVFFAAWTLLQAAAIRRFVVRVPISEVVAVRGASELLRAVSNPLADAGFLLGLARVTRGRIEAILAAAFVPFVAHLIVLLLQATLALALLSGAPGSHRDVTATVIVGWAALGGTALAIRFAPMRARRIPGIRAIVRLFDAASLGSLLPFCGWFVLLSGFDVAIQGIASRAFGVEIAWSALIARIPILYVALSIPSFGNFGTRELIWAGLFEEFAPRSSLIAFAFATNTLFLVMNVAIGMMFLPRAIALLSDMRKARREGRPVPAPLVHDASDP